MALSDGLTDDLSDELDLNKMKVADLKKELKTRGLPTTGNKTELVERLQEILSNETRLDFYEGDNDGDGDQVDDDDIDDALLEEDAEHVENLELGDSLNNSLDFNHSISTENKEIPKKIVINRVNYSVSHEVVSNGKENVEKSEAKPAKAALSNPLSAQERLELRAKRFNISSTEEKKIDRTKRFGPEKEGILSDTTQPSVDALKKRAERFGFCSGSLQQAKTEELKELRKKRFLPESAGDHSTIEKKAKRAERFGVNPITSLSNEEKKAMRFKRFALS